VLPRPPEKRVRSRAAAVLGTALVGRDLHDHRPIERHLPPASQQDNDAIALDAMALTDIDRVSEKKSAGRRVAIARR
jgi:hypothetical protein